MSVRFRFVLLASGAALAFWLSACSPSATAIPAVTATAVAGATAAPAPTQAPAIGSATPNATAVPTSGAPTEITPLAGPTPVAATPAATIEARVIEVEWPPQLRLGESDIFRLSIIPADQALVVTTEFANHTAVSQTVAVEGHAGYDLYGVARLDAAGFSLQPAGEQAQALVAGQPATWRWTMRPLDAGQQRLAISLRLRWLPQPGRQIPAHETTIYEHGFTIQVLGFLRLTTRELATAGVFGLVFGCTLSLPLAAYAVGPRRSRRLIQWVRSNPAVRLEQPAGLILSTAEASLLRALFYRYHRLVIEAEFRSGYSGARTFLARPIRLDGMADAYTIAKIGESNAMRQEFENYENFVKDTLPPLTARIESPPVVTDPAFLRRRSARAAIEPASAALRYTFIGEPGDSPTSMREALLANPDPALLEKLFSTIGPNWWLQRRPYSFRLGVEYDRLLPTHFVLEPLPSVRSSPRRLDARAAPANLALQLGDVVQFQNIKTVELRPDGRSLALAADPVPGQAPLRLRWTSLAPPAGRAARVLATRDNLLRDIVVEFDRYGLPDPLEKLPAVLDESVAGTQSIIHGDLNLENILVGPGGFVWLIDFARTRVGHTLFDFAYLEASLIGQVLSPTVSSNDEFLSLLERDDNPLRAAVHTFARQCLYSPTHIREYQLALFTACLGALKFTNLDRRAKHHLYLTAAYLGLTL